MSSIGISFSRRSRFAKVRVEAALLPDSLNGMVKLLQWLYRVMQSCLWEPTLLHSSETASSLVLLPESSRIVNAAWLYAIRVATANEAKMSTNLLIGFIGLLGQYPRQRGSGIPNQKVVTKQFRCTEVRDGETVIRITQRKRFQPDLIIVKIA